MAIQTRGNAVHGANLGLYLDRPPLLVPERGLSAGANFRIRDALLTNQNIGWSAFNSLNLDGKPVTLITEFQPIGGVRKSIFGNTTDLFQYVSDLAYITPIYATGTASCSGGTTVTGSSTAWNTGTNAKAGDFISFGANDETDPDATWYEVASITSDTELELTGNGPSTGGLGNYTLRQVFAGSFLDPWLDEAFINAASVAGTDGDRWYATNGVDGVVAWDGTADQVYQPDLDTIQTCKVIRRYKNTMAFCSPTYSGAIQPGTVRSSAIGQPENVTTLEASEFIVHDGVDPIIGAEQIGELLAMYTEKSVTMAQYVGTPFYYVFRTAVTGYGAKSPRAIVRFPAYHLLMSSDGQYRFDGVSFLPHSTHVWKAVARVVSPGRKELMQGVIDEGNAELIWVMPLNTDADTSAGGPENAYVGHYLEDVGEFPTPYSYRELPATAIGKYLQSSVLTWDQISDQWDEVSFRWNDQQLQSSFAAILFGTLAGDIYQLNTQQSQVSTVPTSYVRFSRRPVIDSRDTGIVKRVYPNVDFTGGATGELTTVLRLYDTAHQVSASKSDEYTITLDGSERFAPFRAQGRFMAMEFGTGPTHNGTWQIEGYDLDTVKGGSR